MLLLVEQNTCSVVIYNNLKNNITFANKVSESRAEVALDKRLRWLLEKDAIRPCTKLQNIYCEILLTLAMA